MLNLDSILWVIPGVVFIYIYNKRRPLEVIDLSGWPYVFCLVVIASITWLPAESINECLLRSWEVNDLIKQLLCSLVLMFIWLMIISIPYVSKWILPSRRDNFLKRCIEWENKEILIGLKTGKVYHCLLWKYPEISKSNYELQTISVVPFKSGYRDKETQKIEWNTYYPEYRKKDSKDKPTANSDSKISLSLMETLIPRSEIVTFRRFDTKAYELFEERIENKKL